MRRFLSILAVILGILAIGCGGHNGAGNPIVPQLNPQVAQIQSANSHVLWGMWSAAIDSSTGAIDLVPLRGVEFNANVQRFLSPPVSPVNLMSLEILPGSDLASGYVLVKVGLRHPFPGIPIYRGFDVRGIVMMNGDTSDGHDPGISYGYPRPDGIASDVGYLMNADGYTRWWNPVEFTDPMPILSYKPASAGTLDYPDATLNAYKYFADDLMEEDPVSGLPVENRGTFSASGGVNSRVYEIQFPIDPVQYLFNLAIDASWAVPDPSGEPDYPPDSFPPDAQVQEPFLVEGTQTGGNAFYFEGMSGGSIDVDVTVYDWQAAVNPSGVMGEITELWLSGMPLSTPLNILPIATAIPGPNGISSTYQVEIDSSMLQLESAGDFMLLGTAVSANPDNYQPQIEDGDTFIYPDAPLAAYFRTEVRVSDAPPVLNVEIPNGGESWEVGSEHAIEWSGGDGIDYVKIEYSKDDFVADIQVLIDSTENDGSWLWEEIPDDVSDTVKVRVSWTEFPQINDSSDQYFAIITSLLDRIVYAADGPAAGRQIYTIDPEGLTEPEQWSNSSALFNEGPKLSPDGHYIMYTAADFSFAHLYLVDVLTGEETLINPPGLDCVYSDFSHDGTKIVSACATPWYSPKELYIFDYDGSNAEQLTTGADAWAPEYSYDDEKIIFQQFNTNLICIYEFDTGMVTTYVDNGSYWNDDPCFSPDGEQVAWATSNGSSCRRVYVSPITDWSVPDFIINFDTCVRSPCFSADGEYVVVDHGGYSASEIALYEVSSGTWWNITGNSWGDYMADWGVMMPH